jgi:hypothetical protein
MNIKINQLIRTVITLAAFLLLSFNNYAQSKSELFKRIATIIDAYEVVVNDLGMDIRSDCNPDCSTISFFNNSSYNVSFDRVELVAHVENRYTDIPWKDFMYMTRGSIYDRSQIFLVFSSPVTLRHYMKFSDYYNKNRDKLQDWTDAANSTKQVHFIELEIPENQQSELLYLFQKLKAADAGLQPLPAITSLPEVDYCEKIKPPAKTLALQIHNAVSQKSTCDLHEECEDYSKWECLLFTAAGVDLSKAIKTETVEKEYPKLKAYWDYYCYSFSIEDGMGVFNRNTTLLQINMHFADIDDNNCWFILSEYKANINYLNPFTGTNILDFYYYDYAEEVMTLLSNDLRRIQFKKGGIDFLLERGARHSQEMVFSYRYDKQSHKQLIEAIVCNSRGEGIFANLGDQPEKYFWHLYNVGLRNFQDAVLLYESIYQRKLSDTQKRNLQSSAMDTKLFWF